MNLKEKRDWKKIFKNIGNILVIISIIFLVRKITRLDINYKNYFSISNLLKLTPTLIIFTILMIFQFFPWKMILFSMTKENVSMLSMAKIFTKSSIMKYIPGNVFQYVGRIEIISENKKFNTSNVAVSVIIESLCLFCAAIIVGIVGARKYTLSVFKENKLLIFLVIGIFLVFFIIMCIYRKKIRAFLEKKNIKISMQLLTAICFSITFFAITFIVQGLLLTDILSIFSSNNIFTASAIICGAYSIGWVVGYITPGASGGIGIRETILCMLLKNVTTDDIILVAVLVFRLVNILGDLLAFGIVQLTVKMVGQPRKS
jgi:hypothetical protein